MASPLNEKELKDLNVNELRQELEKRKLDTTGLKAALAERLKNSLTGVSENIENTEATVPQDDNSDNFNVKSEITKIWAALTSLMTNEDETAREETPREAAAIKELRLENDELRSTIQSLQERCAALQEERDSVTMALKVVSRELYAAPTHLRRPDTTTTTNTAQVPEQISIPDDSAENQWQTVTGKKKRQKHKPKNQNKPNQERDETERKTKEKTVIIAGDSTTKYLQEWKMSRRNKVKVCPFPGSTVDDMSDYLKPLLRKQPHEVILHVGTNDLASCEPRETAERIVDLAQTTSTNHPDIKVTISSLIIRNDTPVMKEKVPAVNKILQQLCNQNEWDFINNSSIKCSHLNSRGLHLTAEGTTELAKNMIRQINKSDH